jgi:hypothetical protein
VALIGSTVASHSDREWEAVDRRSQ